MNSILKILLLIVILTSFGNQIKTNSDIKQINGTPSSSVETNIAQKIGSYNISDEKLLPILQFESFEKYCETSTGLNNKKQKYLFRPKEGGIFGLYSLVDKENNVIAGWLTIHSETEKLFDWRADDTTQTFIKILLQRKGSSINLFKDIGIGSNINQLINELGKPQIENDTIAVYWDSKRTIGVFKISNNLITNIQYGRYNDLVNLPLTLDKIEILK